jgi:hypothetical protein
MTLELLLALYHLIYVPLLILFEIMQETLEIL